MPHDFPVAEWRLVRTLWQCPIGVRYMVAWLVASCSFSKVFERTRERGHIECEAGAGQAPPVICVSVVACLHGSVCVSLVGWCWWLSLFLVRVFSGVPQVVASLPQVRRLAAYFLALPRPSYRPVHLYKAWLRTPSDCSEQACSEHSACTLFNKRQEHMKGIHRHLGSSHGGSRLTPFLARNTIVIWVCG